MPNYLCIRRNSTEPQPRGEMPSPAEMQAMYAQFHAWSAKFKDNIVDMGGKLSGAAAVVTTKGIADGPFVEAKELVGGFMILSARTLHDAIEIARACPGVIAPGGSLEVREIVTS